MIANLFFIKRTNGLFYYSIDYLRECGESFSKVLVRPGLKNRLQVLLPGVQVVECSFYCFLCEILIAAKLGEFIFTPSSHPIPFINNQLVVMHDYFPFFGFVGRIKKCLFKLSLTTSKCMIGFINQSDVKPYLNRLGCSEERLIFMPNKFPHAKKEGCNDYERNHSTTPLYIGLIGSDSGKKNYEQLFASHLEAKLRIEVKYLIYGHHTDYYDQLLRQFPGLEIQLVDSDKFDLDSFFSMIGLVISVASNEGFGRPIASALLTGIPCYLIDQPVFREFYGSTATFFRSIPMLIENLNSIAFGNLKLDKPYEPPLNILLAFDDANKFLKFQKQREFR